MELKKNKRVLFNENPHKYFLVSDDFSTTELSGITAIIKKVICPDLYGDVDEAVLMKAAEWGTKCHKICESYDNGELELKNQDGIKYYLEGKEIGVRDGACELNAYIQLCEENDLMAEASEYLVSDNEHFASCIDKVLRESKDEFSILDFKFTYSYHEEPVMWQTSFYADMLEAQNPGCKVKHLYCCHIKFYYEKDKDGNILLNEDGTAKMKQEPTIGLHELKRVPTEYLNEAKRCFLEDEEFHNPLKREERQMEISLEDELEWEEVIRLAGEYDKKKKVVIEKIKQMFLEKPNTSKLRCSLFTASQGIQTHSKVFDEERFKAENPEMWKKYKTKDKVIAARTTIVLNKKS